MDDQSENATDSAALGASAVGRLARYLYLADLVEGKRVLEVGCGDGRGAEFLAWRGARRVTSIDPSAEIVEAARRRHGRGPVEFRCERLEGTELEGGSFDCALAPDGEALLRSTEALDELRRLLARGATLALVAPSRDRPAARGGVSYYELVDRLAPLFGPVRMIAETPFVAAALAEYERGQDQEPEIELDASLVELEGAGEGGADVAHYVALCGPRAERSRPLSIVQYPTRAGLEALASAAGAPEPAQSAPGASAEGEEDEREAVARARAEAERAREARSRSEAELERLRTELERRETEAARSEQAWDEKLARERERAAELEREVARLANELDAARGEDGPEGAAAEEGAPSGAGGGSVEGAAAGGGAPAEVAAEEADAGGGAPAEVAAEEADAGGGAPAEAEDGTVSERIAEAMERHAERVRDLEAAIEERQAYADELADELARSVERERALVSRAERAEGRVQALEEQLGDWRTRAAVAEGALLGRTEAGENGERGARARWESADSGEVEDGESRGGRAPAAEEAEAAKEDRRVARGDGHGAPARGSPASRDVKAELARADERLRAVEEGIRSEAAVVGGLERGLRELSDALASEGAAAPGGTAEGELEAFSRELGAKDAELAVLHVGLSSIRERLREVIGYVREARREMEGGSADEMLAIMDQLSARLSAYEEMAARAGPEAAPRGAS